MIMMIMLMMINHDADHVDDEYDDDDDYDGDDDDEILPVDVVEYFRRLVVDDIVLPDLGTVLELAYCQHQPLLSSLRIGLNNTQGITINKQN